MMRSSRSSVLMALVLPLCGVVLLSGCATEAPKADPTPVFVSATPQQAEALQAELQKTIPGARVGKVSSVNTQTSMVAVSGIPLGDVHQEDSIQFRDSKDAGIANGTIKMQNVDSPQYPFLIVEYSALAGGRAPKNGDLAVYLPHGK